MSAPIADISSMKAADSKHQRALELKRRVGARISQSKLDADVQREFRLRQPWASFFVLVGLVPTLLVKHRRAYTVLLLVKPRFRSSWRVAMAQSGGSLRRNNTQI